MVDRYHRKPGRSWSRYDRGGRFGDRHVVWRHRGGAGAQRHNAGRTVDLGAVSASTPTPSATPSSVKSRVRATKLRKSAAKLLKSFAGVNLCAGRFWLES